MPVEQLLIHASWKRCQISGLSPEGPVEESKLNGRLLHDLLEQNEFFLKTVRPYLKILGKGKQNCTAVVVNADGYILSKEGSLGDENLDRSMDIGTNWSEEHNGTNAMGVVLHEKTSAVIKGPHHYCRKHRILTCAASPVFNPKGELLGAVNVSTTEEGSGTSLLQAAKVAAAAAESSLYNTSPRQPEINGKRLYKMEDIAGACEKVEKIKEMAGKAAMLDYPVIIYGESGTGKELLAQSLHTAGPRRIGPFTALNCSALPETLIESELFGYEKGAFTGAQSKGKAGKFEEADGGTILLDEAGDLSLKAQGTLLRVLQEKKVTRVGGGKEIPVDVRVIAATNKNLQKEIAEGRFRKDLYYRLKGIYLTMPPLRERTDIMEMAEYLLQKISPELKKISRGAAEKIVRYSWPGNVRELESLLMQAAFLSGGIIQKEHVQFENDYETKNSGWTLEETEKNAVLEALEWAGGNVSLAAERLQTSRSTLYAKMKKYNLNS